MRRKFAIVVALLLLPIISPLAVGDANQGHSVEMYVVAVSKVNGKLVGEYSTLNVTVVPSANGGHIYISGYPLHDVTFSGAAWLAAHVACSLLGTNFDDYDYYFSIKSNTYLIEGPSAGAAMTIGVISALLGIQPRKNVVITGEILPGGFIGPVGGVSEKIYGVKEVGATVFLVPIGQLSPELKEKGIEMGIDVVGVLTVSQALPYFIGKNISLPEGISVSYLKSTYLTRSFNSSFSYLKEKISELRESKFPGNSSFESYYDEWLSSAENGTKEAKYYASEGMYYTAISKLFQANISVMAAQYLLGYLQAKNKPRYLGALYENVSKNVKDAISLCKFWPSEMSVEKFMVLAAAQERAIAAERLLEKANATIGSPSTIPEFLYDLAYANARAGTVSWWYYFPCPSGGKKVDVYGVSTKLLGESEALLTYAERSGILNVTYSGASEIQQEISLAVSKNMLPAIFSLAAELQGLIMSDFVDYYYLATQNLTWSKEILNELKEEAIQGIKALERNETLPITPLAYLEFGDYLAGLGGNMEFTSAQMYWSARVISEELSGPFPAYIKNTPEYQPIRLSVSNGISAEIFLFIGIVSGIVIGALIFGKKGKEGKEEGGDIERKRGENNFIFLSSNYLDWAK